MTEPLYRYDGPLVRGRFRERPNRFTLVVDLEGDGYGGGPEERVYLRNSGGLGTVLEAGRTVLCRPVESDDRKTNYDAVAVDVDGTWVTVDATLPNRAVEALLGRDGIGRFAGYELVRSEPPLPDGGRSDFLLGSPAGDEAYLEVKSNTYVVDGVSKFPDRPTERGRRHLRSLIDLASREGVEAHVLFVVQRPDASRLRPFREVDPDFAELLGEAGAAGVGVGAVATAFDPPDVVLRDADLPVAID